MIRAAPRLAGLRLASLAFVLLAGPAATAGPAAAEAPGAPVPRSVTPGTAVQRTLVIGSKVFTESVILGEIATQALRANGVAASHRRELGGSRVLWDALLAGQIDAYPEYTGTIAQELLAGDSIRGEDELQAALRRRGLRMSEYLGFDNTYVLGVAADTAARLQLQRIGDLRARPRLRLGFSSEFMQRKDGWPGLRARYALPQTDLRGLDHQLAYRALAAGSIDVTDLYATDPEIARYGFVVLEDELGYFPEYRAVFLMRADAPAALAGTLDGLAGLFDERSMAALNARAAIGKVSEARIASEFLAGAAGRSAGIEEASRAREMLRNTGQHLVLTGVALLLAILVGVPLGILAARRPRLARVVLGAAGIVQTIPSLALLVFMIPVFGIGFVPACAALFLYGLLPIVRNTCSGLLDIPAPLRESAEALGLDAGFRLRHVDLPLATRSILAGIKTSAVIGVGTATLAALIGAGGLGQPIVTGLRLNDFGLILQGAVPAALLALGVERLFDALEHRLLARTTVRDD